MNRDVVEVQVRAVLPLEGSFAVFLGNADKTFVIYVDESVGTAISMFMRGVAKDRPLTHDLLGSVLLAFGARVERVVINHVEGSVFHARLILSAANELHQRKVVELDARPSDSIAMAVQQGAPLFVARSVFDTVEDVTDTLAQIEKRGLEQPAGEAGLTEGQEEMDPEDLDLEGLELEEDEEDEEDVDEEDEDGFDDGYQGNDDDDDEGEEWKKSDG
jgi:uncharacterized protein